LTCRGCYPGLWVGPGRSALKRTPAPRISPPLVFRDLSSTALVDCRFATAVVSLRDVGAVRRLRLIDKNRRVRRAGRQHVERVDDQRHGAFVP
jgi:hypothetical protein